MNLKQNKIICADDFGLSQSISAGILELLVNKKINATSIMVEAEISIQHVQKLKQLNNIALGLHFNLTEKLQLQPYPLNLLLNPLRLNKQVRADITNRLITQLDIFEQTFGRIPAFIDGHQHVHVLPVIRNILFTVLNKRYSSQYKPWLRQINHNILLSDHKFKSIFLNCCNLGFRHKCRKNGFASNKYFIGSYSLNNPKQFEKIYYYFHNICKKNTVMMCHPAKYPNLQDPLTNTRCAEYLILNN